MGGGLGGDFLGFYTAGHLVAHGNPEGLADRHVQRSFQEGVLGSSLDAVALWVSPPYFAWFFVPLAQLPYVAAYFAWILASLAALWFAFRTLGSELGLTSTPGKMLWIGVQYYPALQWLLNGQMSGLWLTVFSVVFVLLRRGRDVPAGLLLGCLACKPPLALGLVVALAAARRFRAVFATLASASTFVALGFLTLPEAMHAYLERSGELVALVRGKGYASVGLHGSFEFATLLCDGFSHSFASVLGVVLTLGLLGSIALLWARSPWLPESQAWDVRMAATLALGLLASPHLFIYDLSLLLLPLFILLARYPERDGLPLGGGTLLAAVALVWALGLLGPALSVLQQEATQRLLGFPVVLQLGVVAVAAVASFVARRAESTSP
jgi:hypothetical protein